MPKKIFKGLLTFTIMLSLLFTGVINANAMSFTESYSYLKEHDYVRDYSNGEFRPQQELRRKEASWLLSLSQYDFNFDKNDKSSFKDLADKDFYTPYIEKNKRLGVMLGVNKDEFRPNATITRYQTAAILNRAFKVKSPKVAKGETCFPDVSANHWAKDDICSLKKMGIVKGNSSGRFTGSSKVTKSEFAMMYARMLKKEFYLDEIDYTFEPEILENTYFQQGPKLIKVNSNDKIELALIQKVIKADKALKEQKVILGDKLDVVLKDHPLSFVITKSQFIGNNGGIYYHKGMHEVSLSKRSEIPETSAIFISNNYNDDNSFSRIFTHEFGHYLGYSILHKDNNFNEFVNNRDIINNPNELFIPQWGERYDEMFAESYSEVIIPGYKNRTITGNFTNLDNLEVFKQWIITSL